MEKEIERLKKVEKVLNDEIDLLNTAFKGAIHRIFDLEKQVEEKARRIFLLEGGSGVSK